MAAGLSASSDRNDPISNVCYKGLTLTITMSGCFSPNLRYFPEMMLWFAFYSSENLARIVDLFMLRTSRGEFW